MNSKQMMNIINLSMRTLVVGVAFSALIMAQSIPTVYADPEIYRGNNMRSGRFYGTGSFGKGSYNQDVYLNQSDLFSEQDVLGYQDLYLDEFYGSGAGGSGLINARNFSFAAASVDGASSGGGDEGPSLEEISRMMNNPLAYLWMMYVENDTMLFRGGPVKDTQVINSTIVQPVMPIPLTDNINLINLPIIPLVSAELPNVGG